MSNQLLLRRRANMVTPKMNYLKFTAIEDNSSVGFAYYSEYLPITDLGIALEYSIDGNTWVPYTIGIGLENVVPIVLNKGESVIWRGYNTALCGEFDDDYFDIIVTRCIVTGIIAASGDITSLLNGVGGDYALTKDYCFSKTFLNCDKLITAPNLPSTILTNDCYTDMFNGCINLVIAPELPATTLLTSCYNSMFNGCTNLTQAPNLPATTLTIGCYSSMLRDCTSLITAPKLPATILENSCYAHMFNGCTNITSHEVATLNNSIYVFDNNSSCASLTIQANTPPMIGRNTITGLKADCKIYVPYSADHSILNAYKTAQYWSARAEYMYELDENGEIPS